MKLCTFSYGGAKELGLIDPKAGKVWSIAKAAPGFGADMVGLIRRFDEVKAKLKAEGAGLALSEVKLLAPITSPLRNVLCVGKNYREHAKEFAASGADATGKAGSEIPEDPIIFTKASNALRGPGDTIPLHAGVTSQLDYEAELAVVIGKGGSKIAKANAMRHVFGYTMANDVTARDLQLKHRQWFLGKSLDGACPMGPYVATADELDGSKLDIRCWVNDELRQNANTRDLIFDIPTLIETISLGMTLEAGDVILTGTPAGVGVGFKPPRFLKAGDSVRIEIEGLGTLTNKVG
ncbi:MAG: fumarylacetoacetate hydrolase family protein [Alphaproteobacteria bacterium]|nr:fumarylacetoacetate hydrolase family protein [Alphaproteobacteria bacterium]